MLLINGGKILFWRVYDYSMISKYPYYRKHYMYIEDTVKKAVKPVVSVQDVTPHQKVWESIPWIWRLIYHVN